MSAQRTATAPENRWRRIRRDVLPPVIALIGVIVCWEILAGADTSKTQIVRPPSAVLRAMIADADVLLRQHIPITLAETLIGLALALIGGAGLAATLDYWTGLKRAVYPLMVISQTIPVIALAPVLILVFRFGLESKIAVVVLFTFFPIASALIDGLDSTDPDWIALLRAMGASRWQVWRKVRLPAALPGLFSGLRIAATYAMGGAIIGEFITAQYGLGRYLRASYNSGRLDQAFAAIVICAALSVALVWLVGVVERIAMPWFFSVAEKSRWDEPGIY